MGEGNPSNQNTRRKCPFRISEVSFSEGADKNQQTQAYQ